MGGETYRTSKGVGRLIFLPTVFMLESFEMAAAALLLSVLALSGSSSWSQWVTCISFCGIDAVV